MLNPNKVTNMADNTVTVQTTETDKAKPKLTEVKVMLETETELAAVIFKQTAEVLQVAYTVQDDWTSKSAYNRAAMHSAAIMFLKSECTARISKWTNLVSAMTGVQQYSLMNRGQVEAALKIHPKYQKLWKLAEKALAIKATLK